MTSGPDAITQNSLIFTPDNKHCYAFSGIIGASSSNVTMLDFTTNTEYLVGKLMFTEGLRGTDAVYFEAYFNGTASTDRVIEMAYDGAPNLENDSPWPILIPPFTRFVAQWATAGSNNATCWFIGRAYGMTKTGYQ